MKWSIKVRVVITPRTFSADKTLYNLSNGDGAPDEDYIAMQFITHTVTLVGGHAASLVKRSLSKWS